MRALIDADLALASLLELIERPELRGRLGARGPVVAAEYAWPRICSRWRELIKTLLAAPERVA